MTECNECWKDPGFILFYRARCPFSASAKARLDRHKVEYRAMDLQLLSERDPTAYQSILDDLSSISGIRTVPQLFRSGEFVGDSEEIARLYSG